MLVMRRRAGESFLVGDEIQIQVLQVSGTRVKLGISAPSSMVIVRREIQITQDENQTAANTVSHSAIESLLQALPALATPPADPATCQDFDVLDNLGIS